MDEKIKDYLERVVKAERLTPELVDEARSFGTNRPDWIGIIAGVATFKDPELLDVVKDIALFTMAYDAINLVKENENG